MSRRPRVAALGGGTGLASALRGLKHEPLHLTAVVTVADDGGSSGRLRRELGVLPPGDIRNCLVALADDESLMSRLFQHRFGEGDLSGHSFGNLFLAALSAVAGGFDQAVEESSHVLKVRGQVLPPTLDDVAVCAERRDGSLVRGETAISAGRGPCRRVWLDPPPTAHPPAVAAIERADLVVLGPGSLFSSVLPHLSVPELRDAVRSASGVRAYVCNIMTQPGETEGMDAADHLGAVCEALGGPVDVVVVHEGGLDPAAVAAYAREGQVPVGVNHEALVRLGARVVAAPLAESREVVRHSPQALAAVLGPLAREAMHGARRTVTSQLLQRSIPRT